MKLFLAAQRTLLEEKTCNRRKKNMQLHRQVICNSTKNYSFIFWEE